jgi:predicted aspartyl protease
MACVRCARVGILSAFTLAWMMPMGNAQSVAQPSAGSAPETPREPPAELVYVARTRPDQIGRIMAPVFVNGQGPFAFVVDTGASRSVISPRIAARLGLVPDPNHPLGLRGITGAENVPSILVDRLQAGDISLQNQRLPVVVPGVFADADGILGVDGFKRMCLFVSFADASITISRRGCPIASSDWPRARAKLRFGGLVTLQARVGRKQVQAIIDTGAERSLGNLALLRTLGLQQELENPASATQVIGATPQRAPGNLIQVPTLYLGEFEISDLFVTFGDFDVFRLWGLDTEPALVVGMDVLGNADGLIIDYRRSEVRVLPASEGNVRRIRTGVMPGRLPTPPW